jgi:ribosomal protein L37AE/L43A
MQNDPLVEWQRLSATYSRMYDAELLQLAADSADLTEQARQVLGDEMRKRGLDAPCAGGTAAKAPGPTFERTTVAFGAVSDAPEIVPDMPESGEDGEAAHEYTWKTPLCGCETQAEALQLSEVLKRAGIDNWIERPGARHFVVWDEHMVGNLQILVPADQLDEARAIAAQPIPKEIVEESEMEAPEFEAPACPKCGAADPVLEGVDPVNSWLCEGCGNEWTESGAADTSDPEKAQF